MLANCKQCQKPFRQTIPSIRLCTECTRLREIHYHKVYRYIVEHPDTTIPAVVEETEIPEKQVLEFIQQGRIQLSGEATSCAKCKQMIAELHMNARIHNGRIFCLNCLSRLSEQLQSPNPGALDPGSGSAPSNSGDGGRRYGFGRGGEYGGFKS